MGKIQLLDNSLINKIAAGEVVERPLNIVKECVENSLDASATKINVEIVAGGLSSITISDNGCGIDKDDVKTAFMRHATSKISIEDDLYNIMTLGFRGEALSSIASVSEVYITTRTKEDEKATKLVIIAGEIIEESEVFHDVGTEITIKNLFFNVPARLKFLKKPNIEASKISDLLTKLAICNPDVKFNYKVNGTTIISTNGDGLKNTIYNTLGAEVTKNLIELNLEEKNIKVKGAITKPNISRSNTNSCFIFINNRYVKNKIIHEAIVNSYGQRLMIGKSPVYAIFLEVVPSFVDVNVHPTKLEVRFKNEDDIYDVVYKACSNALKQIDSEESVVENINLATKKEFVKPIFENNTKEYKEISVDDYIYETKSEKNRKTKTYKFSNNDTAILSEAIEVAETYENNNYNKYDALYAVDIDNQKFIDTEIDNTIDDINNAVLYNRTTSFDVPNNVKKSKVNDKKEQEVYEELVINEPKFQSIKKEHNYKIVGQVFNTYWILEKDSEMSILDQHAAHERVTYERFKRELKEENVRSQTVLEPKTVTLSFGESNFLRKNLDKFNELGFDIEEFGENVFAIRSFPMILDKVTDISFFYDILKDFEVQKDLYSFDEETVIMKSCKASIKGNQEITFLEAKKLIDELFNEGYLLCCPHGRPILTSFTKKDIEKMFKRIV